MRILPKITLLLVLLGLLAPSPSVHAQQGPAELAGIVVDSHGRPVSGATVRLTGSEEHQAVTQPGGTFRFATVSPGSYTIAVQALGYGGEPRSVQVAVENAPLELVVDATPLALEELQVVTSMRGTRSRADLPVKIDVVDHAQVERQQTLAANPTELLANLVPSFSPSRQKLTSAGESFRGRRPLFLIDGVPQSNPLRDGRRDGFTIGMDVIERVEVVFGANATQGLGATGGLVNYITVSPPASGELEQHLSLSSTSADDLDQDGLGWRAHYRVGKRFDAFDVLASVTLEDRGLSYDGEGRPVGVDNTQGDLANSDSRNLFAKVGWEPDAHQRLQLMVSDFELSQNGGFISLEGDRDTGVPTVATAGEAEGRQPVNDVTTFSLDYEHTAVAGGVLSAKVYGQDFSALYGGGTFGVFQDPSVAPVGELFEQSENNSEKLGARLTWDGVGLGAGDGQGIFDVVAGMDFLRDQTFQRLVTTDRNWVPETHFLNWAPFVQAEAEPISGLSLSGGLRWEVATLDVPDFTTIPGNRDDYQRVEVTGGSPGFDQPLLNVGAVVKPTEGLRVYGTFAQAFTMPDVGRVLRGVSEEGTAVESFLDLQPIETDNVEVGTAWGTARSHLGVTWFRSESDFGSRLVPNDDGIFQVTRAPTRTEGWEFTGRLEPSRILSLQAGYSVLEGTFDGDDDGDFESDLGAADVGPDRLNVSADLNPGGRFSGRVQAFHYFDTTVEDATGATSATFVGYTTTDVSGTARFGATRLTLSVANIFDQQYITYYGQAGTTRADRYFSGRGRTLTLRVGASF